MPSPYYQISDSLLQNRRSFILATSSLAVAALWSGRAFGAVTSNPKFSSYPFQLGVASGDPAPDGFVLWTRLAPEPLSGGGMPMQPVEVSWQVAEDEQMSKIVRKGKTIATPEWAHSVHVEVDGLQPGRWYWYQFKAGSEVSPKGRTRTMPPINSTPDQLRFAFASCQHYEYGYFTAYDHMCREDLDLVVHLGDYIYEYGPTKEKRPRVHPSKEIYTLEEYRNRYALYKMEESLKAMHAAAPWIVTWDDHEVSNNYANDVSEKENVLSKDFLVRRAAAYKAYYEHMPLRRNTLPKGPDMKIYRQLPFGRLADFHVLDTRQYRTDQPCNDGNKPQCLEALSPDGTIMGAKQRDWLFKGLQRSSSQWNVLAQQVMMARVDRAAGPSVAYSMDQWPGYEMDRRRVLKFLHEKKIKNPVVLSGDIHTNWANELIADFDQLDSQSVATEFVGTSITSGGDGMPSPKTLPQTLSENPFVKFHNAERGYVSCTVTPKSWRSDYRTVEYVTRKDAPVNTRASFVVESGRPFLNKV
ncbi:MAG: Alkaline phosphatase [Verrucomicrobiales bacterium]|nr:Alkaline phosphatase [Verrucomicrobiales bacterium]